MDQVTAIGDRGASGQGRGGASHRQADASRQAMADAATAARAAIHAIDDVAPVLDGALPPPVQARITALMEEVERLRAQLAQARRHEDMLRDLADHHPTLPVHHRRAFVRELTRLIAQAERSALPGVLAYLHVGGIEALRDIHGPEAAEAALARAIEIVRLEIQPADAVGYLEGGDFAVALAMTGQAEGQVRAQRLADRLAKMGFLWNGIHPEFVVTWICMPFGLGNQEADTLLRAAEAGRRMQPTAAR